MDLDLALVRAFVFTADELNFGRAADQLHLTQQALSKRIRRLEGCLSVSLFVRTTRSVELTEAGRSFLPHARALLSSADAAVASVTSEQKFVRVDVLDDRLAPARVVRHLMEAAADLPVELSMRRGLPVALRALQRGEIDVAFGRVRDVGVRWPVGLEHRLVRLEPLLLAVGPEHPYAGRTALRPDELRGVAVRVRNPGSAREWSGYLERMADQFGMKLVFEEEDTDDVFLTAADIPVPAEAGVRLVPMRDPTPVFPWSIIRRRNEQHSGVSRFFELAKRLSDAARWNVYDPERHWLPAPDLDDI